MDASDSGQLGVGIYRRERVFVIRNIAFPQTRQAKKTLRFEMVAFVRCSKCRMKHAKNDDCYKKCNYPGCAFEMDGQEEKGLVDATHVL